MIANNEVGRAKEWFCQNVKQLVGREVILTIKNKNVVGGKPLDSYCFNYDKRGQSSPLQRCFFIIIVDEIRKS